MKALLFTLIFLLLGQTLVAQQSPDSQLEDAEDESAAYEAYSEDEFPEWMLIARRAEVIFIGAFPVGMLFSSIIVDGLQSLVANIAENRASAVAEQAAANLASSDNTITLISGLVLSTAVVILDFFLGRRSDVADE